MAACMNRKSSLTRLVQLQLQRLSHSGTEVGPTTMVAASEASKRWRKVDCRSLGINVSMVPEAARIALKILQNEGHDAYLVGGCVRDLLLNKTPKDFDIVTTANLKQIRNHFHRAFIVGRRFPICLVYIRGSTLEVSSFETTPNNTMDKQQQPVHFSHTPNPAACDPKDFMLWRNSLCRDFTINSLFYDPFARKIYDYCDGMADLKAMKLRTLVPAHLSFQEDSARILRGLRIAARLGFSFAKDTDKAIRNLYASVKTLDKARIMMELNYMLSYGAAEPSLLLLRRFKILDLLLPFQAAYLNQHSGAQNPVMLVKLFFSLDRVASCDQPCNSSLWVALLAFHLALVNNPQDALVVSTFASLLYHGKWKEGLKAARELCMEHVLFKPEIFKSSDGMMDDELGRRVASFAAVVLDSIYTLTDSKSLCKAMDRYPCSASSGLVFVSKNAGKEVSAIFNVLADDIESLWEERHCSSIDYDLLGKGDIREARFVLGKIIMDTMRGGMIYGRTVTEKQDDPCQSKTEVEDAQEESLASLVSKHKDRAEGPGLASDQQYHQKTKKQKHNVQTTELGKQVVKEKLGEILSSQEIAQKRQKLRRTVVKDVRKLLSLQKEGSLKNGEGIPDVLRNVPKIVSNEAQAPKEILGASEMIPEITKQYTAHGREVPSVLKKPPQMTKQLKEETPTEMVNIISLSNIFKASKDPSTKLYKAEKQPTAGDPQRDESTGMKRKLSNIFR